MTSDLVLKAKLRNSFVKLVVWGTSSPNAHSPTTDEEAGAA